MPFEHHLNRLPIDLIIAPTSLPPLPIELNYALILNLAAFYRARVQSQSELSDQTLAGSPHDAKLFLKFLG